MFAGYWVTACGCVQFAHAQSAVDCEQAGRAAEQKFGLPPGLLLAIGQVESGQWDAGLGRMVPSPWAVDVDGDGRRFDNSIAAVNATREAQAAGRHNIDVGCFQISLMQHPDAFADLGQAFDPQANAQYAARFLASLQVKLGNWQDATAAYHSATPLLGLPYRQRVFAAWLGSSDDSSVRIRQFPQFPGIHVWTPGMTGAAPEVIWVGGAPAHALPHVITPSR